MGDIRIDHPDAPMLPPDSTPSVDLSLLDRYLTGEATPAERDVVDQRMVSDPSYAAMVAVMRSGRRDGALPIVDTARAKARLRTNLQTSVQTGTVQRSFVRQQVGRSTSRQWLPGVLGVAAVCGLAWFAQGHHNGSATSISPSVARYSTRAGEQRTMTLDDGTRIILGPNTRVSVGATTAKLGRTIELVGVASFTVPSSGRTPFSVRTGQIMTRVLGTTFSVERYASDASARVTVTEGKVASGSAGHTATIAAGYVAMVTDSMATIMPVDDATMYTDLPHDQLVFKRTPVAELLATVGRWYGYEFKVASPAITARHVSLTLKASDPADMVTALQGTLDVDLHIEGRIITVTAHSDRGETRRDQYETRKPFTEMGR